MSQMNIPPDIDEIHTALSQEVTHLHVKWKIFCQLYASGDEVVDLLNSSASGFFHLCQEMWGDDILLTIGRLIDPKQSFKKDNLSLGQLVNSIDRVRFPTLKAEIERLLAEAKDKCDVVKDHRNKRIAHNDLTTKLQPGANLIPAPTKQNIEDALKSIRDVVNSVPKYFRNSPIAFVNYEDIAWPFDGNALITRLREAKHIKGN
jgi:hypothetical protein